MSPKEPNEEQRESVKDVSPQVTPTLEEFLNNVATIQQTVDEGIAWLEQNLANVGNNVFTPDAAPILEQIEALNLNDTIDESQDSSPEVNMLLPAIVPQTGEDVHVNNDLGSNGENNESGEGAYTQEEDEGAQEPAPGAEEEQVTNPDDGC